MGKNKPQQSLAGRNISNAMRSGSAGASSAPPSTTDADTTPASAPGNAAFNDTGRASVPSDGAEVEIEPVESVEQESESDVPRDDPLPVVDTSIEVPSLSVDIGYVQRRIDVRLTSKQAARLNRIKHGLTTRGARLANGSEVKTSAHALCWMLEQDV